MPSSLGPRVSLALALASLLAGCGDDRGGGPVERTTLRGIETHEDSALAFGVVGDDLPRGATCTVTLEGNWHAPGQEARPANTSLPCSVNGAGQAVVQRAALGELSLPVTFVGDVSLEAHDRNERTHRAGPMFAEFALDGESPHAAERLALQQRMREAREQLGVTTTLEAGTGLLVTTLAPASPLAREGVAVGDVLLRLGPVPLLLDSALVLSPHVHASTLVYLHAGSEHRVSLALSEHAGAAGIAWQTALWVAFAFACAGAFVAGPDLRRASSTELATRVSGGAGALLLALLSRETLAVAALALLCLPAGYALRAAETRRQALHALCEFACSLGAGAACVVQARTSAHHGDALPLALAPWLWLCIPALFGARPSQRVLDVVRFAAASALWMHAALPSAEGVGGLARCAAYMLTVVTLAGVAPRFASSHTLTPRALCAALALSMALAAPSTSAFVVPLTLLTCALLGLLFGHVARRHAEVWLGTRATSGVAAASALET